MRARSVALALAVGVCGCGEVGANTPWDQNGDGLVQACEGLSRSACSTTPGCAIEALACPTVCIDDGKGGCVPCDDFRCKESLPFSCAGLTEAQCTVDPRCELTLVPCPAAEFCPANGDCSCRTSAICRPKPPLDCRSLSLSQCGAVSACQVVSYTVCAGGGSGSAGGAPVAADAGTADAGTADFRLPDDAGSTQPAFDAGSEPPPPGCGGGCYQVQQCEPRPKPSACTSRSASECSSDGRCKLEPLACAAVCLDEGDGGCWPCPASHLCVDL